jgi:Leucine-rich repeat (LRR) protein
VPELKQIIADTPTDMSILNIDGGLFTNIMDTDFSDRPLKQLTALQVKNTQLQEIYSNAFTQMNALSTLDLQGNRILTIQANALLGLNRLEMLDLSNNAMRQIPSADMLKQFYYLKTLDLSNNFLSDFPNGMFVSQSNLQELRIEQNKNIVNLRGPSFQGLRTLRKFLASGCSIQTLENDLFQVLSSVDTLDLSANQLRSLPNTDSFRLLYNLRNLTLSANQIEALVDGQFANLDLDVLDLSKNIISSISPNAFIYMKGVRQLDLSGNKIHNLPSFVFQPIASEINILKLNDNRALINLPGEIFKGMQKMRELNLSSCAIQSIDEDLFQQVFSLRHIDISNNWLQNLPQSFIDKANYMQHVKIENNPWNCDCYIQPLLTWLQDPRTSTILYCTEIYNTPMGFNANCPKPKCSVPGNLVNMAIGSLSTGELKQCEKIGESTDSSMTGVIIGIVAGLVVVALIIIIVACCLYRRHQRGQPLLCFQHPDYSGRQDRKQNSKPSHDKHKEYQGDYQGVRHYKKEPKMRKGASKDYYEEKKQKRRIDADSSSLNESDKSFVVRNFFHSMIPDPDGASEGTQSMTRKDSQESLSQSGIGYGSRRGSRCSSQYSVNAGLNIESAV